MQFSIPQIRHFNDLYYISVNLLHIEKGKITCRMLSDVKEESVF